MWKGISNSETLLLLVITITSRLYWRNKRLYKTTFTNLIKGHSLVHNTNYLITNLLRCSAEQTSTSNNTNISPLLLTSNTGLPLVVYMRSNPVCVAYNIYDTSHMYVHVHTYIHKHIYTLLAYSCICIYVFVFTCILGDSIDKREDDSSFMWVIRGSY